jgi:predicted nuclease of restriction endonuclease-like (RecB) superfamily
VGSDFAFITRQKRVSVDSIDYYLDLLFYHRRLRRLVAIELKIEKFEAADKGRWSSISAGWRSMRPARAKSHRWA